MKEFHQIWINARFLARSVTGVERVAIELLKAFEEQFLDHDGCLQLADKRVPVRLVVPNSVTIDENPFSRLSIVHAGIGRGHLWEQISLPLAARGKLLLNLCNTGPILKRRNMVFLHDAGVFHIPESYSVAFRYWYRFLMYSFALAGTSLMTNSQFSQSGLAGVLKIPKSRLPIVTLGHEHVRRIQPDESVLDRCQLDRGRYVLAVGSANPLKNHAGFLEATSQLGDDTLPCIVVGRFNTRVFANSSSAHDNAQHRAIHVGAVTDEELMALYQHATLLVIPSFYEGFGLPPLEAMALGCPVLLSDRGSLPEVGGDAAQFCNPDDATDIANAIERICADAQKRDEMSRRGQERAQIYSWATGANNLRTILEMEIQK